MPSTGEILLDEDQFDSIAAQAVSIFEQLESVNKRIAEWKPIQGPNAEPAATTLQEAAEFVSLLSLREELEERILSLAEELDTLSFPRNIWVKTGNRRLKMLYVKSRRGGGYGAPYPTIQMSMWTEFAKKTGPEKISQKEKGAEKQ